MKETERQKSVFLLHLPSGIWCTRAKTILDKRE